MLSNRGRYRRCRWPYTGPSYWRLDYFEYHQEYSSQLKYIRNMQFVDRFCIVDVGLAQFIVQNTVVG